MMVRAVAYEMQAKEYGGLKSAVSKQLQRIATWLVAGDRVVIKAESKLKPGARLVREWNRATHVVEVVDDGSVRLNLQGVKTPMAGIFRPSVHTTRPGRLRGSA